MADKKRRSKRIKAQIAKNDLSSSDDDSIIDDTDNEVEDPTYMPEKDPNETEVSSEEDTELDAAADAATADDAEAPADEDHEDEEEEYEEEDEEFDEEDEDEEYYEYDDDEEDAEDDEDDAEDDAEDDEEEEYSAASQNAKGTHPLAPIEMKTLKELPKEIQNKIISMQKNGNTGTHIRFDNSGNPYMLIIKGNNPQAPNNTNTNTNTNNHVDCAHCKTDDKAAPKRGREDEVAFTAKFTKEENEYWKRMSPPEKDSLLDKFKDMKSKNKSQDLPLRFKLLQADLDASSKSLILAKLDQFQKMPDHSGEYFKLRNWLNGISRLPLSVYKPLPIKETTHGKHTDSVNFLKEVKTTLDKTVFGQNDVKNQLMRIMAQWISNPDAKGNCIGLQGSPGVGKTSLIKQGLCTALGLPFGFISLGGASDASFLEGHGFTYEGSTYGKIAEILMKTKCMNPVFFFDELDKVSHTYRGEEIIGILTHLTDSSQNERFNDRYFGEIDLNLSKALIIFSYNDESKINHILKDRMITIHVDGYDMNDKVNIATDYLIPELLKEYRRTAEDIVFSKEVIEKIIEKVSKEDGVRNLKRGLESIISWLNMHTYLPVVEEDSKGRPGKTLKIKLGDTTTTNSKLYTYPVIVTEEHIEKYIKNDPEEAARAMVTHSMYL
jgi:ATP-dependent Lon protease